MDGRAQHGDTVMRDVQHMDISCEDTADKVTESHLGLRSKDVVIGNRLTMMMIMPILQNVIYLL